MKTLSKLNFNPEKLMKNDELKTLKGGEIKPICQEGSGYTPCFCSPYGYFAGCAIDCNTICSQF
jgi:hypothetical protein